MKRSAYSTYLLSGSGVGAEGFGSIVRGLLFVVWCVLLIVDFVLGCGSSSTYLTLGLGVRGFGCMGHGFWMFWVYGSGVLGVWVRGFGCMGQGLEIQVYCY